MKCHTDRHSKSSRYSIPVILLLLLFAQLTYAGTHTSITLDEPLHMTSGFAHLTTGDYRLTEEHPPLMKALEAIPLLPLKDQLPEITSLPGWEQGNLAVTAKEFIIPFRPIDLAVISARIPTMLVAVILGAFVYRWAMDFLGSRGANLALLFFIFDPNILAHAALAATDLGAAWGMFVPTYMFWRWLRRTRLRRQDAVTAGVILGLGLATKLTVLMLGPIFTLAVLIKTFTSRKWRRVLAHALIIVVLAFLTLWAVYGFEFGPIPELPFRVPFPSHMLPIRRVLNHNAEGHAAFLLGENYLHGNWRYFPIAFALKTPILTLALLVIGLGYQVSKRIHHRELFSLSKSNPYSWLLLVSLPILYFAVSIASTINIGYRHLLPILPFIFVICADAILNLLRLAQNHRVFYRITQGSLAILLCLYAITTLKINPWHLSYFNAFAGGPENGYKYLVDSNLDWGQTWKALAAYQQEHNIENFNISAFTFNDPDAYGITYTLLPPFTTVKEPVFADRFEPAPGDYAISTTQLQSVIVAMPGMYDYFQHLKPDAKLGYAMFVYHIPETKPADWIAQCNHPVTALTEDMILEGFRSENAQRMSFDCTQTWLIPPGKGFTIIPQVAESITEHVAKGDEMRLSFEQTYSGWAPPFSIFERTESDPVPAPDIPARQTVNLSEYLTYQGYSLDESGDTLNIYTYWYVRDMPPTPISLMAHILDSNENTMGVSDGLGAAHSELMPGSMVIQKHSFAIENLPIDQGLTLWVGAYTWPDLVRYEVTVDDAVVGDAFNAGLIDLD